MSDNTIEQRLVFHHVNIKTTRLQEMIDWYGTVLGMKVNFRFPYGAFLSHDEANHRIALLAFPGIIDDPDRVAHIGMHHVAFEYPSIDMLIDTYLRLKEVQIKPHFVVNHGVTTSFYYQDPDGGSVELQVDNLGSWIASTEWMKERQATVPNVVGVTFDPEAWIMARRAGASLEELDRRSMAGEFPPTGPMDLRLP